jgi:general secretion pathway protein N
MKTRLRLVTVGAVTLIIGLVVVFPARVAYQWFAPPTFALTGISGSVWSGSALAAQVNGVYLRDLKWRAQPLALFTGQLAFDIEASTASGFVEGNVGLGIGGETALTEFNASLSLHTLQQTLGMPGLTGMLNAQFDRIVLVDGIPVAAEGTLEVANLVAPMVTRSSIGGYRVEFFTQESGVMASVEDTDGVVDIAGSLQLSSDGTYQFIAQLVPKTDTPADLRQQMQFLGTANERGQYEMRLEGQL